MTNSPIYQSSAIGIRESVIKGELSVSELARKLIEYVKEVDGEICALTNFNPEQVLIQAQFLDNNKATGEALGPLHGVPVVLKDIIDTEDHPTENGID
ncbi:MAG: amidase family protein, partial [Opitutae bacterium]